MKFLNNMKIGFRLNLVLSIAMAVIMTALGIYVIQNQKAKIISDTDTRMFEQVNDLTSFIELQIEESQKSVQVIMDMTSELIDGYGGITIDEENGNEWLLNGKNLNENFDFVDNVSQMTGAAVSIFRKDNTGYTRVSTTIVNENGTRELGTKILNNSPVAQSINSGQVFNGRAKVLDEWMLTSYESIKSNGETIGILGVGYPEKDLAGLREMFSEKKYFDSGYPYLVADNGNVIIHPTNEGGNFSREQFFKDMTSSQSKYGKSNYIWEGKEKYQYFNYISAIDSYVSVTIYEHELMGIINRVRNAILIALILGIGLFLLVNTTISRSITLALNKGVQFAETISKGDLSQSIDIDQKDEIGQLAAALNNMVKKLKEIVGGIIVGSDNIASASQQTSSTSEQISQGATEQASSVEEVSSTMEEIVANVEQNTSNAQQTEKISQEAQEGIRIVKDKSLSTIEANRTISDKIQIINDIAFQTNLLALNAAVEAARAGDHGKGFAVVAAEVRKLAERSKVAADEIVKLTVDSLRLSEEVGKQMEDTLPKVENTTKLVQEITASSLEQNNGANQVNNAIQMLNDVTQQNAAASEEMATSAEELASQADQLKELISFFEVDDLKEYTRIDFNTQNKKQKKIENRLQNLQKENKPQEDKKKEEKGINLNLKDKKDDEFEKF